MKVSIKGNEFNPSLIFNLGEKYAIENGYDVYDVPEGYEDCAFEDFDKQGFNVQLYNKRKEKQNNTLIVINKIQQLKGQLQKYKEDVEQVDLFGMQRDDYQQKKQLCAEIVLQLRQLESEVQDVSL